MSTLDRTILMAVISTTQVDGVTLTLKKLSNMGIIIKLSALIHVDISISDGRIDRAMIGHKLTYNLKPLLENLSFDVA